MSKFLKFIVGLILVVFIGAGAALIVPQFVGNIDTIIVQDGMISNKPIGTVIYARKEQTSDIQVGDKVVDMNADSLYVHEVLAFDFGTNTAQVTGGTETAVRLGDAFTRAVVSVPLIGYLTIATQSLPGLILLGLLLALVIVLFIVSEALRRNDDEEDDDDEVFERKRDRAKEEEDDRFYRELAEKKLQTQSLKEIADAMPQPTPPAGLFDQEAGAAHGVAAAAAGAAVNEGRNGMMELSEAGAAAEEAPAGKEEKPLGTGELPDVQAALEAALENQQLNHYEHPKGAPQAENHSIPEEPGTAGQTGEIELAMPVHTAEELVSKAHAAGMEPKVKKDSSGVTFIDYSDCL